MLKTAKLFYSLQNKRLKKSADEMFSWEVLGKQLEVDCYEPRKSNGRVLLIIHGMSVLGARDPRLQQFARSFAKLGFKVCLPNLPSIKDFHILESQTDEIAECIRITREKIANMQKISVLSVSFSGSLALAAIVKYELNGYVSALMNIGFTPSGDQAIRDLLDVNCGDNYAHYIAIKNALRFTNQVDNDINLGLDALIKDDYDYVVGDFYADYKKHLGESGKHAALDKLERIVAREPALTQELIESVDFAWLRETYPFDTYIADLKIPFYILQAAGDPILRTEHINTLAEKLVGQQTTCRVRITKTLDHADVKLSFSLIKDFILTFNFMGKFLQAAISH